MKRRILLVMLILFVLLLAGALWGASRLNLSALEEPGETETYLATKAKRWVVGRRARGIVPPPVENPSRARAAGQMNFGGSCATCHGYDGRTPSDIGRSQYPPTPDLGSPAVQEWTDAELFWIIKHGVRLSGMPGFGRIHSDEEIWNLVRFVRSLGEEASK
ncbi:MAG: c-type cytochrome [Candidatus Acidiferrales bacterium]